MIDDELWWDNALRGSQDKPDNLAKEAIEEHQSGKKKNKKTDITELSEKVLTGLRKALRKLVETSAANNESLVIADEDGSVKLVLAKELLPLVQNN